MNETVDKPEITEQYLKDFVRKHEYRVNNRISKTRTYRLKRRLKLVA